MGRRIPSIDILREELKAWETDHNQDAVPINWQFTNDKARIKLARLYPDIEKFKLERDERRKEKLEKLKDTENAEEKIEEVLEEKTLES